MTNVRFPEFTGKRCLMMPYIQGDPGSVPREYATGYEQAIAELCVERGEIGFLTIDESVAVAGQPHRGKRAKYGRALHTEAGFLRGVLGWGSAPSWGGGGRVLLDRNVRVLIASSIDDSCAVWDAEHEDTSEDGDIGDRGALYPYDAARLLKAGEVANIGILTPHESLPLATTCERQFLRILSTGVHGREDYFTVNPLVRHAA